jgi:hypothetical protein
MYLRAALSPVLLTASVLLCSTTARAQGSSRDRRESPPLQDEARQIEDKIIKNPLDPDLRLQLAKVIWKDLSEDDDASFDALVGVAITLRKIKATSKKWDNYSKQMQALPPNKQRDPLKEKAGKVFAEIRKIAEGKNTKLQVCRHGKNVCITAEGRDCENGENKIKFKENQEIVSCYVSFKDISESIKLGRDLIKKGEFQKSYDLLSQTKGAGSQESERLIELARAQRRLSKIEDAYETLTDAKKRDPWRYDLTFNYACYSSLLGFQNNELEDFVNGLFNKRSSPKTLTKWLNALDSDADLANIRKSEVFVAARWQIDAMAKGKKLKICVASQESKIEEGCRESYHGSCLEHAGRCQEGFNLSSDTDNAKLLGCYTNFACQE